MRVSRSPRQTKFELCQVVGTPMPSASTGYWHVKTSWTQQHSTKVSSAANSTVFPHRKTALCRRHSLARSRAPGMPCCCPSRLGAAGPASAAAPAPARASSTPGTPTGAIETGCTNDGCQACGTASAYEAALHGGDVERVMTVAALMPVGAASAGNVSGIQLGDDIICTMSPPMLGILAAASGAHDIRHLTCGVLVPSSAGSG